MDLEERYTKSHTSKVLLSRKNMAMMPPMLVMKSLSMQPWKIYSLCLKMKYSISWLAIQDCDCCCMNGLKFEQR
ncbi:hypothetical protein HanRHA438_Chr17g0810491 [Helianthus annuus]|nr:hypothetical protein HanHA89_Chr17g0704361 [Helianthus annuus]KAJ0632226.1 hypothetical protein HanLR1_Chr17g0662741 [Helianthus annuus]KAJ0826101.1 hypothetical protein HanRHA438_Chr17g0810491 [Helianthus annuus]